MTMNMTEQHILRYAPYCGTRRLDWARPVETQGLVSGDTIRLKAAPLRGGVNLSSQERQQFASLITRCLEKAGAPPGEISSKVQEVSTKITNTRVVKNIMSSADQWMALKQAANTQGITLIRQTAGGSRVRARSQEDVLATNDPWAAFATKK